MSETKTEMSVPGLAAMSNAGLNQQQQVLANAIMEQQNKQVVPGTNNIDQKGLIGNVGGNGLAGMSAFGLKNTTGLNTVLGGAKIV